MAVILTVQKGDIAFVGLADEEVAVVVEFQEAGFAEVLGDEIDAVAGADVEVGDVGPAFAAAAPAGLGGGGTISAWMGEVRMGRRLPVRRRQVRKARVGPAKEGGSGAKQSGYLQHRKSSQLWTMGGRVDHEWSSIGWREAMCWEL